MKGRNVKPEFTPWLTPERRKQLEKSAPKDSLQDTFNVWKGSPDKVNTGLLLKELQPTISSAMNSYAPGSGDEFDIPAKMMALDAVKRYDPKQGAKLNTHVFNSMKSLNRLKADRSNIIHIPENVLLEKNKLNGVKAGLESELGREPTIDELADRTGISPARIEKINKYRNVQSESSMLTEKGDTLFERKKDPHKIWAEYVYHDLDPVDKKIYEWSTGYGGNETYKKGEIARRLNMSAPAVSQRINKIIAKLEEGYFLE
jgi:DNA-directed RNA polymerase specialized sigma subunit